MTRNRWDEHPEVNQGSHADLSRRHWLAGLAGLIHPWVAGAWKPAASRAKEPKPAPPLLDNERAEGFMRRAIELGRNGMMAGDGGPFGAVIVKDGAVVGEGWNRVVATNDPTAHGEIVAIRNACQKAKAFSLKGCELYTSGEPCPMCLSAIYWARLERVFYGFSLRDAADIGFDDRYIYEELTKRIQQRKIPETQILREEALKMLKAYAADPKRVKY